MLKSTGYLLLQVIFCLFLAPPCFGEGDVESLKQFEYWPDGKMKQCMLYDAANGYLKAKVVCRDDGTIEKVLRYDNYGNKTEEALYDQKGRLKTGIDGWAAMRWWYNANQLVSQISYDENGTPRDKRIFSESGRLVLRQYRDDANFDPYEGANMAMLLGGRNIPYYDTDQKAN